MKISFEDISPALITTIFSRLSECASHVTSGSYSEFKERNGLEIFDQAFEGEVVRRAEFSNLNFNEYSHTVETDSGKFLFRPVEKDSLRIHISDSSISLTLISDINRQIQMRFTQEDLRKCSKNLLGFFLEEVFVSKSPSSTERMLEMESIPTKTAFSIGEIIYQALKPNVRFSINTEDFVVIAEVESFSYYETIEGWKMRVAKGSNEATLLIDFDEMEWFWLSGDVSSFQKVILGAAFGESRISVTFSFYNPVEDEALLSVKKSVLEKIGDFI